jgi:hypothetical protein
MPTEELNVSDEMERLAVLANEGYDVTAEAWLLCGAGPCDEEFTLAWDDFRQAVRDRDDIARPATRDWRDVLGEDAASTQDEAHDVLCTRADEALLALLCDRAVRRLRAARRAA